MDQTSPQQLRIMQFNIQSVKNKIPLLVTYLCDNNIDICLLNETWLKDSHRLKVFGYSVYYKNSNNGHGGVAILIKNNIKHIPIHTSFFQDIQNIAITVDTSKGPLTILCVYCPPSSTQLRLQRLSTIINNLSKPLIVSGDFNAHHVAFGCRTTKSRGQVLYDVIDNANMCILNDGNMTTVPYPRRTPSAIDVTFVSAELAPLCEWTVHDDPLGSDHFPTITTLTVNPLKYKYGDPIDRFVYKNGDWKKFFELSQSLFSEFCIDPNNPLKSYDEFCETLNYLKSECIPKFTKTSSCKVRPPSPWWNDECKKAVIKSYEALKFYRRYPTEENFISYKRLDALKKRTIATEKKNSWRNLCTSFNRTTHISKIWNNIKMLKGVHKESKTLNDLFIEPFLNKLSQNIIDTNFDHNIFCRNNEDERCRFLLEPFTLSELKMSLNSRKDTAPGLDDFPYLLIKKMHPVGQKVLLCLFNLLWTQNLIPETWKTQCVIPILKQGKPPDDANSYRPISLSSCIGKLFENLIKVRIEWYVEVNNILPNIQFGFRRGKSCADSFTCLISDLKHCKHTYKSAVCAFLDVQGAFDNLDPGILVNILLELNFPGHLCKWIYKFLTNRSVYIRHNNFLYGPKLTSKGTMQGSILSPILYNLYTSQILKYVNNIDVNILQFADDIVVYSVNSNLDIAKRLINTALSQIHLYYKNKLKLNINSEKSSVLIFSKQTSYCQIKYNNQILNEVEHKKFLGIIIDNKLSFERHINYRKTG